MTPASDSSSSKPTVEALLRLKRGERPDDAFWGEFEVRMRQKQLAASIEPKPWWLGMSLVARRFSLPAMTGVAGAAGAAAVMGFMVVRSTSSLDEGGYALVAAEGSVEVAALAVAPEFAASEAANGQVVVGPRVFPVLADAKLAAEAAVNEFVLASAPVVPAMSEALADAPAAQGAGSEDFAAAMVLADAEPVLAEASSSLILAAQVKLVDDGFTTLAERLDATSWTVATLASPLDDFGMKAVFDAEPSVTDFAAAEAVRSAPAPSSRLEQLLAMDEAKPAANKSLGQVRDRVLHRFGGDEELYASVSRLGVGGDRLSLRF